MGLGLIQDSEIIDPCMKLNFHFLHMTKKKKAESM